MKELKQIVYKCCREIVEARFQELEGMLKEYHSSVYADTKSSMGDKYETSREMLNQEKGKVAGQLKEMAKLKATLEGIDPTRVFDKAQLGSLIKSNHGLIFISVGLGQVKVEDQNVIVISAVSPLGQQLLNKKQGEKVSFGPRSYELEAIQ